VDISLQEVECPLTNHTEGGEGTFGHKQSLETRKKHSDSMKAYFSNVSNRQKTRNALLGHIVSAETRGKQAAAMRGRKCPQHVKEIASQTLNKLINSLPNRFCKQCNNEFKPIQFNSCFCCKDCAKISFSIYHKEYKKTYKQKKLFPDNGKISRGCAR